MANGNNTALQVSVTFKERENAQGEKYYVSHRVEVPFPLDLADFVMIFLPGSGTYPPKVVFRPRSEMPKGEDYEKELRDLRESERA